jgi:hypothetical protein
MRTPLLSLQLQRKRDLLVARRLVRQAAALLGFSEHDQTCLAAAAFDLACQAHAAKAQAMMACAIVDDCLQIVCSDALHLSRRLPVSAAAPREDVPWLLKHLTSAAPADLFEEVCKINQELLKSLLEQAKDQPAAAEPVPAQKEPSAA